MLEQRERRNTILIGFGVVLSIYIIRLFFLQVFTTDFVSKAEKNVVRRQVLEPSRGIIYDRKGKIYVTNNPMFDLFITPSELYIPDTSIFEQYLGLSRETIRKRIQNAQKYSPHRSSLFEKQINFDIYYRLQEHLWKCKGIYAVVRITRDYLKPVGANFLGYLSEVQRLDIEKSNGYYKQGDLIGTSGLERNYEPKLRGRKGVKMVMEDVIGREVGSFAKGKYDTIPLKGNDIVISIDTELQEFGEELMQNKVGSIVAIEPATGEILAFVSSPTYNPKLLSGTELASNFRDLSRDSLKPLFNRPLMAMYPPGSVFKILNALIALQEGTIDANTYYGCAGYFSRNPLGRPRCHAHPAPLNTFGAIQFSCNAFFASAYVDFLHSSKFDSVYQSYEVWRKYMDAFGVGRKTGIDIPSEKPGLIPQAKFYDKWYGKKRWGGMTIVSNAIGQGEVLMTPLQMTNVVCAIANRGYYIEPHFFKRLYRGKMPADINFPKHTIPIYRDHFELVIDAMEQVVNNGTGYLARLPDISICGKTGTAENPHGKDHSVFFAFAPKDDPKIAIAVIIENAGWGGEWAAPMASLMIEKYLKGKIRDEWKRKRILDADFIRPKYYYIPTTTESAPAEAQPGTGGTPTKPTAPAATSTPSTGGTAVPKPKPNPPTLPTIHIP